jgi:hypothetical protein
MSTTTTPGPTSGTTIPAITAPIPIRSKGEIVATGAAISIVSGSLVIAVVYGLFYLFLPDLFSIGFFRAVIILLSVGLGIVAGFIVWDSGKQPDIPIGWRGVPTILRSRSSRRRLYPEGINWVIPFIGGYIPVNMKGRPLFRPKDDSDPKAEEIVIDVLVKVLPAPTTNPQPIATQAGTATAPSTPPTTGAKRVKQQKTVAQQAMEKLFFAQAKIRIAVRIQVFDPFLYLSFESAEALAYNFIAEKVRLWAMTKQIYQLPNLKEKLRAHLEAELDGACKDMGIDFIKLAVVEVELPQNIQNEAALIAVELIQRSKQIYQAETVEEIMKRLRAQLPNLGDTEMKNFALQVAELATTQVVSIEGQRGTLSVVGVGTNKGVH